MPRQRKPKPVPAGTRPARSLAPPTIRLIRFDRTKRTEAPATLDDFRAACLTAQTTYRQQIGTLLSGREVVFGFYTFRLDDPI
jgi:hypothetical protein